MVSGELGGEDLELEDVTIAAAPPTTSSRAPFSMRTGAEFMIRSLVKGNWLPALLQGGRRAGSGPAVSPTVLALAAPDS